MSYFEPYTLTALLLSFVILAMGVLAQGKLRRALITLWFVVDAIVALLLFVLGAQGLQIGLILLLPFVLSFFAFLFANRSTGVPRVFFITLGLSLCVLPLALEAGFLLPELFSATPSVFDNGGDFKIAKTTFTLAMVVVLATTAALSFLASLVALARELWSQRKGKVS